MKHTRLLLLFLIALSASCIQTPVDDSMVIALVADGRERAYTQDSPITVGEFLRAAEVELGPLDEVNPPDFTQISDGMRITVVRVQETTECERVEIPRRQQRVLNELLSPGEERLGQAGQNGVEELCYRVVVRDGQREDPVLVSRTLISAAQDEVIYVGPDTEQLDPIQISGTLAYVSNGNAWIVRDSSTSKRLLTTSGDLDGRVFALSADGRRLLFTRETTGSDRETFFNRLWMIADTATDAEPLSLLPENVLFADWVPGQTNTISYSTGEITTAAPGWRAHNDLSMIRIDAATGETLDLDELVPRSTGGLSGWWGTQYQWSPDGTRLAWVRADRMGLVDLINGIIDDANPLIAYTAFNTRGPWSWRANVSWSADGALLLTTIHGDPIGSEPAETSPAFHVSAIAVDGSFNANLVTNAGIWSAPQYSANQIAYLKSRDLSNSISETAAYDLVVADRDGSNAEIIFPPQGQSGLTRAAISYMWSPDGQEIAFVYQGNLWIIDVTSKIAHQLTLDGGVTDLVWTR